MMIAPTISRRRSSRILVLTVCACILPIFSIQRAGGQERQEEAAQPDWPSSIRLGVLPIEGNANLSERFKVLADHIQASLGVKVVTLIAEDYDSLISQLSARRIECAYMGPLSYVQAAEKAGAQAIAQTKSPEGESGYYSLILSLKSSSIKSMEDAKGAVFAYPDRTSTSGFLVPQILFQTEMKVKPAVYFKEVLLSGSHENSIQGLLKGSYQIISTNNLAIHRAVSKNLAKHEDFRVLWKSQKQIPGSPFVVRADLSENLKAGLLGALVQFNANKNNLKALDIGGFNPVDDQTYDIIRDLSRLQKDIKEDAEQK